MDKTIKCREDGVEGKVTQSKTSGKVHPDDVEMEEAKRDSPNKTDEADEADQEPAERPRSVCVSESGDNLCTMCGFLAKCPRSLKIHYARKHGKNLKNTVKTTAAGKSKNLVDVSPMEIQQEVDMEECELSELRSAASDNSKNTKGLIQKQTNQEEMSHTQGRRVSKRTPKPKMIYSCNYCGQEFRDQAPLDVHVQRYHVKDTPYTCEYMRISEPTKADVWTHVKLKIALGLFKE